MRIFKKLFVVLMALLSFHIVCAQKSINISIVVVDEDEKPLPDVRLEFPDGTKMTVQNTDIFSHVVKNDKEIKALVDSIKAEKEGYNISRVEYFVADAELTVSMEKVEDDPISDDIEQKWDELQALTSNAVEPKRGVFSSKTERKSVELSHVVTAIFFHKNKPIINVRIVHQETDYHTDYYGKVMLPLAAAEDNRLYIEGYKVIRSRIKNEEVEIEVEEMNQKESFVQNLSLVANEIKKEQETYEHTSERLNSQIEDIVNKLKNDKTLTAPERKQLNDYLKLLVDAIEKNEAYYRKNKTKRDSLLETMNILLLEKEEQNRISQLKIRELEEQDKLKQADYNRKIMMVGGVAVLLLLIASTFIFLAGKLRKQKKELERINAEVLRQKEEITILYTDISDNISAAKIIQNTILPTIEIIRKEIPKSFVFFHPRDVVSGDFYWCHRDGNRFIIAAVDCTGHGVAGAFMTFIAYKILNQITRDHSGLRAGEILTMLNQELISSLNQYESGKTNAGMDIALCVFEDGKNTVEFAGANNPLYLLRFNEIFQTKADKQGIGGKQKQENYQFTTHTLEVQKGDKLYLFSDGYAGQIGGPNQTDKFMFNRFRDLLVELSKLPEDEQVKQLGTRFQNWRGQYEQLDDLLVIGMEIA